MDARGTPGKGGEVSRGEAEARKVNGAGKTFGLKRWLGHRPATTPEHKGGSAGRGRSCAVHSGVKEMVILAGRNGGVEFESKRAHDP